MFPASLAGSRLNPLAQRLALTSRRFYGGIHLRPSSLSSRANKSQPFLFRKFSNSAPKNGADGATKAATAEKTFLQKFLGPKEMPRRGTLAWYGEMVLICTVFAITGTSTMMLVGSILEYGIASFLKFILQGNDQLLSLHSKSTAYLSSLSVKSPG